MVFLEWGGEGAADLRTGPERDWVQVPRKTKGIQHPGSTPPLTPYQARHTAGSCLQEPPTTALIIVSAASGGWDAKLGEC